MVIEEGYRIQARRFKKRGMSWSRAGPNNLLKPRIQRQDWAAPTLICDL
jgi:hypothetical protein